MTTAAYMTMAAVVRPAMFRKMPIINRKIHAFDARFTTGTSAPRIFMGA